MLIALFQGSLCDAPFKVFSDKTAWLSATRRIHIVIKAFEIETRKRLEQLERTMHQLLDTHPMKKEKAIEHELKRRNQKLEPLGELTIEEDKLNLSLNFAWDDLSTIPDT